MIHIPPGMYEVVAKYTSLAAHAHFLLVQGNLTFPSHDSYRFAIRNILDLM